MHIENELPRTILGFIQDRAGNSFFEYALLASLASVVCLIALLAFGKGS